MGLLDKKWYMQKGMRVPDHVTPGHPRREVAQEFWANVIGLGEMARENYITSCKNGERDFDQREVDELDTNLNICRAELAKYQ